MTHTDNIDVGASLSEFIQKSALKEDGPQRHWIKAVYYHLFQARDGNPPKKELVLSFTDTPLLFSLSAKVNRRALVAAFGTKSQGWIGKLVELYYEPNVIFGSDLVGGSRVRIPALSDEEQKAADIAETMPDEPPPPDDVDFA